MTTRTRKTVNLDAEQSADLAPFLDQDSTEHGALEMIIGRELSSDSEELAALALLGARHVRRSMLTAAYDRAVDEGAFDETDAVVAAGRRRWRRIDG